MSGARISDAALAVALSVGSGAPVDHNLVEAGNEWRSMWVRRLYPIDVHRTRGTSSRCPSGSAGHEALRIEEILPKCRQAAIDT
jgi:hypothetical protein